LNYGTSLYLISRQQIYSLNQFVRSVEQRSF
jgi:hypothetical protein